MLRSLRSFLRIETASNPYPAQASNRDTSKSFILLIIRSITLVFARTLRWPGRCTPQGAASCRQGGIVSQRTTAALLTMLTLSASLGPVQAGAQQAQSEDIIRRSKNKVWPPYPDLAKKMNIVGTVKVEAVVAPNGTVKDVRVVGGHPVLATAALDAAKKCHFDPSS